ncbi:MAG: ATP-binding protein [Firmicutes bacterium]|nr:ATP-binding protein [Bacillota bacterium]
MYQYFNANNINHIFRFRSDGKLITRESTQIEFKEAFNWNNRAKYGKTMAAFANNSGGFIVFGVTDTPREAIGLHNERFTAIDEEQITLYLNSFFSPEIRWEKQIVELNNKRFGLIYTCEAKTKPVVCTNNDNIIKESDIFYRYNGRSERIRYPELRRLIEVEREKERLLWMNHMQKISKIGLDNLATIDLEKGIIDGNNGNIYLDESIVSQIEFIKEGEFDEVEGAKTLKLVGEVQEISRSVILPTRTRMVGIHTREFFESLLKGMLHQGVDALEYLEGLPYERSKFMPIFVYLDIGNITKDEAKDIFRGSDSTATQVKSGLIERLDDERSFGISYFDDTLIRNNLMFSSYEDYKNYVELNGLDKSQKKSIIYNLLVSELQESLKNYHRESFKLICEVVTLLTNEEMLAHRTFLTELLLGIYDEDYNNIAMTFRYAIAHIDKTLYSDGH